MNPDNPSTPCNIPEEDVQVMTTIHGVDYVRTPVSCFKDIDWGDVDYEEKYETVSDLQMAYIEAGPANGEVVLMLHGQPTWSYLHRKMIPIVANAGYRVIAADLIGMGRSDKPISLEFHQYDDHTVYVKEFIENIGLSDVTLFGQDWGSIIGLRVAGENLGRFARIVIANGDLPVIPEGFNPFTRPTSDDVNPNSPRFREAVSFNSEKGLSFIESFQSWIDWNYHTDVTPADIVQELNEVTFTPDVYAGYNAPFPSLIYKAGPRALPSMLAGVGSQTNLAFEALGKFEKPFLTLFGRLDSTPMGSEENQKKWTDHVPGAAGQPHDFFPAHHFIQEEIGETLAERMVSFMQDNPL